MCGICGIVDWSDIPVEPDTIRSMVDSLQHRGPDDNGIAVLGAAGLGHTRLSIIDLSPRGHQPMSTADGRYVLSYNGELYNYRELRSRLVAKGVTFSSESDTEVVLQALVQWGSACLREFNGMFAFALWDNKLQRLLLARDRFGIKPLYYHATARRLIFASEIKAILATERNSLSVDGVGLHEYMFYGNALGTRTLFAGISKLEAAHYLEFTKQGVALRRYWSAAVESPRTWSVDDATQAVREHLERAVHRHLVSDVPIGIMLSGGIDSSAITALASRQSSQRLRTFSVGFDFPSYVDEIPKARLVAERFATEHTELRLSGVMMPRIIETMVDVHDQPFGDSANIPLYICAEQLKGLVKVVLQGDGGDEMFGGYRRYAILAAERWWRGLAPLLPVLTRIAERHARLRRFTRMGEALGQTDPATRMALLLTEERRAPAPTRLLGEAYRESTSRTDPFARYREIDHLLSRGDAVQRMLQTDASILLPDIFLEKVDRPTMAHGVEVRVPFLDTELSTLAMGLPSTLKVRHLKSKWLLRRALRGVLPSAILDARKTGFGVPYGFWLRGPLAEYARNVLLDDSGFRSGLFDRHAMTQTLKEHQSGAANHGFLLYKSLSLAIWHRKFDLQP